MDILSIRLTEEALFVEVSAPVFSSPGRFSELSQLCCYVSFQKLQRVLVVFVFALCYSDLVVKPTLPNYT